MADVKVARIELAGAQKERDDVINSSGMAKIAMEMTLTNSAREKDN